MKLGTTKELSYHNTFIEAVDNGIEEILEPKQTLPWSNISKSGKTIINELLKRDYLVFTKADKREATVILDVENYIEKANNDSTKNTQKLLKTQLKHFSDNKF